jgi:hypothetical protein
MQRNELHEDSVEIVLGGCEHIGDDLPSEGREGAPSGKHES